MVDEPADPAPVDEQEASESEAAQQQPSSSPGDGVKSVEPQAGSRRNFFWALIAIVAGGIVGIVPLAIGLYTFLIGPFQKKQTPLNYELGGDQGAASNEYFVAPLGAIPEDGMPRRFEIVADRVDAWSFIPGQAIGAIFLSRQKAEPGQSEVVAFHATCPHAGCTVALMSTRMLFSVPATTARSARTARK